MVHNVVLRSCHAALRPPRNYQYAELRLSPVACGVLWAELWWLGSLSQVGYGDHYPITWQGKLLCTCTMFVGILVLALPIMIIGAQPCLALILPPPPCGAYSPPAPHA